MNILPIPLAACIMAGLMAATMSTCDIYLVSGVNQLVRDVAQYFLKIRDTKSSCSGRSGAPSSMEWPRYSSPSSGAAG